jgi:predicted extracellular nuclease
MKPIPTAEPQVRQIDWHGQGFAGPTAPGADPLRIASWNIENFVSVPDSMMREHTGHYGDEPLILPPATPEEQEEYLSHKTSQVALAITQRLGSPHILAVQEMLGDAAPDADGTVPAHEKAQLLIDAIRDAGGPKYCYAEAAPMDNSSGGKRGANIRCGYLYRPDRVELYEPAPNTAQQAHFAAAEGQVHLAGRNPAPLDVKNEAFKDSRKPLVAEFIDKQTGEQYFLTNVHLVSRRGAKETTPKKRYEQAASVARFNGSLGKALKAQGLGERTHLMVCGDFNIEAEVHYTTSEGIETTRKAGPIAVLEEAGFTHLMPLLPANAASIGRGKKGIIMDHLFASPALAQRIGPIDMIELNQGDNRTRLSDHNPTVVAIHPPERAIEKPVLGTFTMQHANDAEAAPAMQIM